MSDELDRYVVYVSGCDHTHSHKITDLEYEHEMDSSTSVGGEWCLASDVDELETNYAEALAQKDSLQEDLDTLQEEYDAMEIKKSALEDSVSNLLADAEDHEVRGYYLIDDTEMNNLRDTFDEQ
jgi:chromosome segregation ATPase